MRKGQTEEALARLCEDRRERGTPEMAQDRADWKQRIASRATLLQQGQYRSR